MGNPTKADIHVNRPLTNISIAYLQDQKNFVADKVFPIVPVDKASDLYYEYDKGDFFRSDAKRRAPGTESAGSGFRVSPSGSYNCRQPLSEHIDVSDQDRSNQDEVIDLDRDATLLVTQRMLLKREMEFADKFFKEGIWSHDVAPATKWNVAASDPVKDITDEIDTIENGTGFKPNVILASPKIFRTLKNHPDVKDRYKYTQKGIVTQEMLAEIFEVEKFLVPGAVKNTAKEGKTASMSRVYGDYLLLCYSAPSPGIMMPSAGYIFAWRGYLENAYGVTMKKFRMEELESDRVEGSMAFDQKLTAQSMGTLFKTLI